MPYIIRNTVADEPDGTPVYYGIPEGTGGYVLVRKEHAASWEAQEEAAAEMAVLGRAYSNAAYLVVEDTKADPVAAAARFREVLTTAIQKAEKYLPESGQFTLEEMSVLRVAMSQVATWLELKP